MSAGLRAARVAAATVLGVALAACSSLGSVGDILGGVLGGGNQVQGTVRNVDTYQRSISLEQSNGQTVALQYDNNTRVVYQNQTYAVTSLDPGDQVAARVQQLQNGGYYTDSISVIQPASTSGSGGGSLQTLQGTVRQIDYNNGWFTMDAGGGVTLTVSLPYNPSSTTVQRFNALRSGDFVRFQGVYLTQTRVELRSFL